MKRNRLALLALGLGMAGFMNAQTIPSLEGVADGIHHWNLEHPDRTYARYAPEQYKEIADNFIAYQNKDGGWPKNIDWLAILPADSVYQALNDRYKRSTLDNRNTYSQIDYLAQVYTKTKESRYKEAVGKGLNYLLKTQKKNGGWRGWDVDAITYNDEVTTGVLELFLRINEGDINYTWLDGSMKKRIYQALQKGIDIILRTQYVQNGVKTVWGQQHDNETLLPVQARTFELPSLVSTESCSVLKLLMEIPHPSAQVELDTNKPFMARRDGTKVYQLSDVDPERRTGYDWYTYIPETLLQHYPQWLATVEAEQAYAGYEVLNNMPAFYQQLKESLTYPLAWGNAPEKDFTRWRTQAREKLLECMQPAPPQADFDMKVIESEQREGYTAQKIVFNISGYSRVPAYLLIPEGEGPFPAVLLLHDHGAHFTIGKEKMVRPFNVSETVMQDADDWAVRCYDGQYVGDFLAQNGYVVLSVDALFWGERGRKEYADYDAQQALSANLLQMGMSFGSLIAWDDIRSAEFLSSLPNVDKEKVGTMGFSMGAHRAWMTMAATDAVKAGAAVCWMNTTDSLMTLTNNQNKGGSAYAMIIPNIRRYMDYPHVASIACPKPMLFTNGIKDKLFPIEGVKSAYETMRQVWESQGAAEHFQTKIYDLPHFCSKEIQQAILEFFNKEFHIQEQ